VAWKGRGYGGGKAEVSGKGREGGKLNKRRDKLVFSRWLKSGIAKKNGDVFHGGGQNPNMEFPQKRVFVFSQCYKEKPSLEAENTKGEESLLGPAKEKQGICFKRGTLSLKERILGPLGG